MNQQIGIGQKTKQKKLKYSDYDFHFVFPPSFIICRGSVRPGQMLTVHSRCVTGLSANVICSYLIYHIGIFFVNA